MPDKIDKFIKDLFNIDKTTRFEFHEMCGFTFVFKQTILEKNRNFSAGEIKPVGIIYEENSEFYFAPLDKVTNIDEIVKEYVEKYLK